MVAIRARWSSNLGSRTTKLAASDSSAAATCKCLHSRDDLSAESRQQVQEGRCVGLLERIAATNQMIHPRDLPAELIVHHAAVVLEGMSHLKHELQMLPVISVEVSKRTGVEIPTERCGDDIEILKRVLRLPRLGRRK